jgi:hypothetical protein
MSNKLNPPINFNPAYDLQPKQIQIIPEFSEKEVSAILTMFKNADKLSETFSGIYETPQTNYPLAVHCIALPQFSSSCWLQGVSVQRIVDQNGIKPPVTAVCLELTRTKDSLSGIMYIDFSTVIYLAERGIMGMKTPLVNNILDHYAKGV